MPFESIESDFKPRFKVKSAQYIENKSYIVRRQKDTGERSKSFFNIRNALQIKTG